MTYYDWICNDCKAVWEEDHPLGKAPKQTECPECGELRDRNWGSVTTFKMKGDCHTNRVRARKYYVNGLDKDAAHEFYDEGMAASKRAMDTGWKHYSRMVPKIEEGLEKGILTKRTDKEASEAREKATKMTRAVYNDIGVDIGETLQRKPQ